jgi:hypothetical protein
MNKSLSQKINLMNTLVSYMVVESVYIEQIDGGLSSRVDVIWIPNKSTQGISGKLARILGMPGSLDILNHEFVHCLKPLKRNWHCHLLSFFRDKYEIGYEVASVGVSNDRIGGELLTQRLQETKDDLSLQYKLEGKEVLGFCWYVHIDYPQNYNAVSEIISERGALLLDELQLNQS